jgi:hypothetical protein
MWSAVTAGPGWDAVQNIDPLINQLTLFLVNPVIRRVREHTLRIRHSLLARTAMYGLVFES